MKRKVCKQVQITEDVIYLQEQKNLGRKLNKEV